MPNWLSDPDEDVRQTAVQIVSLAAGNGISLCHGFTMQLKPLDQVAFSDTIKSAIPKIAKMFQDEDEDVRVAALNTCSAVVKVQQGGNNVGPALLQSFLAQSIHSSPTQGDNQPYSSGCPVGAEQ
jgi:hypothetical protein